MLGGRFENAASGLRSPLCRGSAVCGRGCAGVSAPVSGLQDTRQVHPCSSPSASCLGRSYPPNPAAGTHQITRVRELPTAQNTTFGVNISRCQRLHSVARFGGPQASHRARVTFPIAGGSSERVAAPRCVSFSAGVWFAGPSEAWKPRASYMDVLAACPANQTPVLKPRHNIDPQTRPGAETLHNLNRKPHTSAKTQHIA